MKGELPEANELEVFNILLNSVANPGPRNLQNRAGMCTAVGGAPMGTAILAGLSAACGEEDGGGAVENVMKMLNHIKSFLKSRKENKCPFKILYKEVISQYQDNEFIPGTGRWYGEKDIRAGHLQDCLKKKDIQMQTVEIIIQLGNLQEKSLPDSGLHLHGLFAAGLLDLGFYPLQGHGLYMIASTIGILAHSAEQYGRKWNEYPHWFYPGVYEYKPNKHRNAGAEDA